MKNLRLMNRINIQPIEKIVKPSYDHLLPILRLNMKKAKHPKTHNTLYSSWIETPVGQMLAIASEEVLHLLEFGNHKKLERRLERLKKKMKWVIMPGKPKPISSIEKELLQYFKGKLKKFKTPLFLSGTPFQKRVWKALMKIPFGKTCSYSELAEAVKQPTAYRAVANANGANQLAVIIPCHRVINANGNIGGYGGGISRKYWLIEHENKVNR